MHFGINARGKLLAIGLFKKVKSLLGEVLHELNDTGGYGKCHDVT